MHACSGFLHKLFPSVLIVDAVVIIHSLVDEKNVALSFFELVNILDKIPSLVADVSLLSCSLSWRSVLILHSVGLRSQGIFDLYFTKRWSFIFSDTRLT